MALLKMIMRRRDFTINAMAISLNEKSFGENFIDPFNGLIDLHSGVIKTPLDPDITFSDDPLRMLRAIRFATQLYKKSDDSENPSYSAFRIDNDTFSAIKRNAQRMEIITRERINDEALKDNEGTETIRRLATP